MTNYFINSININNSKTNIISNMVKDNKNTNSNNIINFNNNNNKNKNNDNRIE